MLKKIIPCLDVSHGRVVKGQQFENIKDMDDPIRLAKLYISQGADELVLYDITATKEKRDIDDHFLEIIKKEITIPFCVGGGISTLEDVEKILHKGANKVSINSGAIKNPSIIQEAAKKFGQHSIVLSVDLKKVGNDYHVFVEGGKKDTGLDGIEWIKKGISLGAGEVVVNSIDRDGLKKGYDIQLLQQVCKSVNVPVIASGGAGSVEDFYQAAIKTNVAGLLAAGIFHSGEVTIPKVKAFLQVKGVPIQM